MVVKRYRNQTRIIVGLFVLLFVLLVNNQVYSVGSPLDPRFSALHILPPIGYDMGDANNFDPTLTDYLRVSVWEIIGPDDYVQVVEFTSQSGGQGLDRIRLQGNRYHVNWDIDGDDRGKDFVIRFDVAGYLIGEVTYIPNSAQTVPIKFMVFNDPSVRARVLKEQGWSAVNLAAAVQAEFSLSHFQLGQILYDEFSADFQEERELQVVIATALKAVGINASQVYEVLKETFDIIGPTMDEIAEIEEVLVEAGFSEQEAADGVMREVLAISNELIQQYGPVVRFHPDEKYFTSSVDWFMERVPLRAGRFVGGNPIRIEDRIELGIVEPLELMDKVDETRDEYGETYDFWFVVEDKVDCPNPPNPSHLVVRGGDLASTRSYVHVLRGEGFTDIQFWYFYPYNGPATTWVKADLLGNPDWHYEDGHDQGWETLGDFGNSCELGVHAGDWEAVILRFDKEDELQEAFMSAHGDYTDENGDGYLTSDLEFEGDHVVAFPSLNGHAFYPHAGDNKHKEFTLSGVSEAFEFFDTSLTVETLNWTSDGGEQFATSDAYDIVAIDGRLLESPPAAPLPSVEVSPLRSALHFRPPLDANAPDVFSADQTLLDYLEVMVCQVEAGGTCAVIEEFTADPNGGGTDHIKFQNSQYHVNWHSGGNYVGEEVEIHVRVADLEVGSISFTMDGSQTVPIKFGIDNHPQVRFHVLQEQGTAVTEIIEVLLTEFDLNHIGLAWVLEAEGVSAAETAAQLKGIAYRVTEVYEALRVAFEIEPAEAVPYLIAAGFPESEAWYAVALDSITEAPWMAFDGRWGWEFSLELTGARKGEILERIFEQGLEDLHDDLWEICAPIAAIACSGICAIKAIPCLILYPVCFATCGAVCFPILYGVCIPLGYLLFDDIVEFVGPEAIDMAYPDQSTGGPDTPAVKGTPWWYYHYPNEKLLKVEVKDAVNQLVVGSTPIDVWVKDDPDDPIDPVQVEIGIDGTFIDITNNSPVVKDGYKLYTYNWDTTTFVDGDYALYPRVKGANGMLYSYSWPAMNVTVANGSIVVKPLMLDSEAILESEMVNLSGTFYSPSAGESDVLIDWGDGIQDSFTWGSDVQFDLAHQYLDDSPSGTEMDLYTIEVTVSDSEGRSGSATTMVSVENVTPDLGPVTASADLIAINTPISFTLLFTDTGSLDNHDAVWDWGDGTSEAQLNVTNPVQASHSFASPGIYEVGVAISDDDGGAGESPKKIITVYDPAQPTYAAGAGLILAQVIDPECEPDPCILDPDQCTVYEEASFALVVGGPGTTEFLFQVGDMVFASDNFDSVWLTPTLELTGTGYINDSPAPNGEPYRFEVIITDGNPDTFAVKIWVESDDQIGLALGWVASTGDINLAVTNESPINSAVYGPDGNHIVTSSADNRVQVWDLDTGSSCATALCEPSLVLTHTAPVNSAAYSPDGLQIVTASDDGTAHVWDAGAGTVQLQLLGHTGPVNSAAYSPDGSLIVTASDDSTARVWDAGTGTEQFQLLGHTGPVNSAAFSPDGLQIVTAGDDGTVRVWDVSTGTELMSLVGHTGPVNSAVYSPDGLKIVTAGDDGTARVWDASTGTELMSLVGHTGPVNSAAFSPDGLLIVTASDDGTVRVWDATTGDELLPPIEYGYAVAQATWSADGSQILTAHPENPQSGAFETPADQALLDGEIIIQ